MLKTKARTHHKPKHHKIRKITRLHAHRTMTTNLVTPTAIVTDFVPSLSTAIMSPTTPRVAIIGSGPSAMYTAKYILQQAPSTHIHIIDRLHTPYGLVRHGIAPDHPEAKNVMLDFESSVMKNPNVTFIGGVCIDESDPDSLSAPVKAVGGGENTANIKAVKLHDLYQYYHSIVIATGAQKGRKLGIPNENFPGVYDAQQLVNWYNGHPDFQHLSPKLAHATNAIIIGNGNVSLDIARFLLAPLQYHTNCDIPLSIRQEKSGTNIQNVYLVARRAVTDAAYTIPELREVLTLSTKTWNPEQNSTNEGDDIDRNVSPFCRIQFINADINDLHESDKKTYEASRPIKRKTDLLMEYFHKAKDQSLGDDKDVYNIETIATETGEKNISLKNYRLHHTQTLEGQETKTLTFVFNAKPSNILTNDTEITGMSFKLTKKVSMDDGNTKVADTDISFTLPINRELNIADDFEYNNNTIVIKSIGYQTIQLAGAPFNHNKSIYPTDLNGRLICNNSEIEHQTPLETSSISSTFTRKLLDNDNTTLSLTQHPSYPSEYDINDTNSDINQKNKTILKSQNYTYIPFVYATGWARRGPTGIIGSNIGDAKEVATICVNDLKRWSSKYFPQQSNEEVSIQSLSQLPPLPLPRDFWATQPFLATTQEHWHKIRNSERNLSHIYQISSWEPISPEEEKKEIDARRMENVASIKMNKWEDFIRTAHGDDIC